MSPLGPIGLFDSGVGGLTVVARILQALPNESIVYYGDTAHLPYGPRPLEEVRGYALAISRYLVEHGAKAIVVACNTSTAAALDALQQELPVPVLGTVEHGVRAALAVARNGCVGVLATQGTVASGAYERAFRQVRANLKVIQRTCPAFVTLVESGITDGAEALAAAEEYVRPMAEMGIDTIVMGCTHYPYVMPAIRQVVGPAVSLVDPSEELARALARLIDERGLRRPAGCLPSHRFLVSGDPGAFAVTARALLYRDIVAEKVDVFHAQS